MKEFLDKIACECLNSLTAQIAILNTSGEILAVNKAWVDFSIENGGFENAKNHLGIDYLTVCQNALGLESENALEVNEGILSVIRGNASTFSLKYPCHSPTDERWFIVRVTPLDVENEKRILVSHEDITEHVLNEFKIKDLLAKAEKAKEAAVASEKHYKKLFNNLIDEVHVWEVIKDNNGDIVNWKLKDVNPMALEKWGQSLEDVIGKTSTEIFGDEALTAFLPIVKNVFETGNPHKWQTFFPPTNQYLSMVTIPFENYFISTGHDISAHKLTQLELERAKEKAEQNEAKLHEAQRLSKIGSWEYLNSTDEVTWSKEMFNIFEISPELGAPNYSKQRPFYTEESYDRMDQGVENLLQLGTPYNIELDIYTSSGTIKHILSKGDIIRDGNGKVIGCYGTAQDITKIKLIQNELDLANKKLYESNSALLQSQTLAKVGSWSYDAATKKIEWSDETFSIWGFDKLKSVPQFDEMLSRIQEEDRKLISSALEIAIGEGKPYDIECRICLISGEEKVVRNICKPITSATGKVIKLVGSTQDITLQKLLEQAQVKDERLKAMGEMAASVAHDFNNSLQGIMGNLEVVKLKNIISAESLDYLNSIGSIVTDVADRVRALQQFSDTKNDNKNTEPINLTTLIEDSIRQSRPLWKDAMEKEGVKINLETDLDEIPNIRGNRGELQSVIHNLIKNSIEAMPEGGDLAIQTRQRDGRVYVRFKDTGVGMNEETKLRIFDPFFTTKGYTLGRGLGMSGVYKIVKKYDGDITITSNLNEGATIELIFPISTDEEKNIALQKLDAQADQLDVLWVDDDSLISMSCQKMVKFLSHNCHTESNGEDALEYLNSHACDLVVTDIGMPIMNGWELAKAIRKKYGEKIKIAVVSGWAVEEKEMKDKSVDYSIQKPFKLVQLRNMFEEIRLKKQNTVF